jgi:hypothetical protein
MIWICQSCSFVNTDNKLCHGCHRNIRDPAINVSYEAEPNRYNQADLNAGKYRKPLKKKVDRRTFTAAGGQPMTWPNGLPWA